MRLNKGAFWGCKNLASITIKNISTDIEYDAFYNCTGLTDIYYNGTISQWNASKYLMGRWGYSLRGNYTVHCTDGDIKEDN